MRSFLHTFKLLVAQNAIARHRQHVETYAAWAAAEVARRSSRENGYSGLAQRKGFASPEALIQSVSQASRSEAARYVRLGTMMAETEAQESLFADSAGPARPHWQSSISAAILAGTLSLAAAEAIRGGLGDLDAAVGDDALATAAEQLVAEAGGLSVEQLHRRARQLRDWLDAEGVARRERERRDARYLRRWIRSDGMYQASMLLDPENGRIVFSSLDEILAPRRGGPRFVDPKEQARAESLIADERTDEQLLADALVGMIRIAGEADEGRLFGARRPAVRVIVTETTLARRTGHGYLEGVADPVALETVERELCDTGFMGIKFDDDGQCVNVGRTQRLFTERQRIGLAARDGGCLWPGCDRPPSWSEAHHIDQWHRDRGRTDIADGVLLCRHHHMLLHNNHWQIVRDGGRYCLKPPRSEDPAQTLRPLRSKSPFMQELSAETVGARREPIGVT